jgi:hypothetical protein
MLQTRQIRPQRRMPGQQPGVRPAAAIPVPYDYGVRFQLKGIPGELHEQVLVTAPDGAFVATAVGYGFAESRDQALQLTLPDNQPRVPATLTLAQLPLEALIEGFRLDPQRDESTFTLGVPVDRAQLDLMLRRVKPRAHPTFLFSVIDTATGRELQDEPTHSLASLGIATGDRPFRRLAYPISFLPRSSLRVQVIEQSADTQGDLFIVFYGYRLPLPANCPEPAIRSVAQPILRRPGAPTVPPARIIPFDYVANIGLTGKPGARQKAEITVSVDNEFVATAIGYGLATGDLGVEIDVPAPANQPPIRSVDLGAVTLGDFPIDALRDGVRLRKDMYRVAFQNNAVLANTLPIALLNRMFERINAPEDVSFIYSIFDSGTGHDLQNIGLHNIAGLGTATGERPFKQLAMPLRLQPNSTIQIDVIEQFGRGQLYIVLQGYKRLGGAGARPL